MSTAVTTKEELKSVEAELVNESQIDQTGFKYKYDWDASQDCYVTPKGQKLIGTDGMKTTEIKLCSFERPHMRGFHYSWMSFFLAFFCWFAHAPLMPSIKATLGMNMKQVLTVNISSVGSTVFARFIMGPLCDQHGPKRCQFFLLCWMSFFVFLMPTVNSVGWLALLRCLIGFGGATFVVTQYWSSMLFHKNIVGLANACTAGWGNLGAGVAYNVMTFLWMAFKNGGASEEQAWRVAFIVPACVVALFALVLVSSSDDSPLGDYVPLMKAGAIEKKTAQQSFKGSFWNTNAWLLGFQYAACFGVELHVNGLAAVYFSKVYGFSQFRAGMYGSVFGWMNLFCRSLGGALSDYGWKTAGMRGRLAAQTFGLFFEGIFLIIFSRQFDVGMTMVSLIIFSCFVQATEGMTFGIVPFVDPKNMGPVCGVVGAWGNIGAVMWGTMFRQAYAEDLRAGFTTLGFIVSATAIFSFGIKIHGHSTLLSSEEYGGFCTEEYLQEQDKRLKALEAKVAAHDVKLAEREA